MSVESSDGVTPFPRIGCALTRSRDNSTRSVHCGGSRLGPAGSAACPREGTSYLAYESFCRGGGLPATICSQISRHLLQMLLLLAVTMSSTSVAGFRQKLQGR